MHNENNEYFYQGIKLKNFQWGKNYIKINVVLYIISIILCLKERLVNWQDGENVEIRDIYLSRWWRQDSS